LDDLCLLFQSRKPMYATVTCYDADYAVLLAPTTVEIKIFKLAWGSEHHRLFEGQVIESKYWLGVTIQGVLFRSRDGFIISTLDDVFLVEF